MLHHGYMWLKTFWTAGENSMWMVKLHQYILSLTADNNECCQSCYLITLIGQCGGQSPTLSRDLLSCLSEEALMWGLHQHVCLFSYQKKKQAWSRTSYLSIFYNNYLRRQTLQRRLPGLTWTPDGPPPLPTAAPDSPTLPYLWDEAGWEKGVNREKRPRAGATYITAIYPLYTMPVIIYNCTAKALSGGKRTHSWHSIWLLIIINYKSPFI